MCDTGEDSVKYTGTDVCSLLRMYVVNVLRYGMEAISGWMVTHKIYISSIWRKEAKKKKKISTYHFEGKRTVVVVAAVGAVLLYNFLFYFYMCLVLSCIVYSVCDFITND